MDNIYDGGGGSYNNAAYDGAWNGFWRSSAEIHKKENSDCWTCVKRPYGGFDSCVYDFVSAK